MKIKITGIFVDDQDKALRFYTDVLGFVKKTDFGSGGYRWLTVVSPEEPDGTELHLETNADPAAKTFQQALFQQSKPAAMFYVDDVQREYERMQGLGHRSHPAANKNISHRHAERHLRQPDPVD